MNHNTASVSTNIPSSGLSWTLFSALSFVWGSSFILIKYGLKAFSPAQVGSLRIAIAGLALAPLAFRGIKNIKPHQWKYLLVVGLLGNAIPSLLFSVAQSGISSSTTGILNALVPLFTLATSVLIFRAEFIRRQLTGLLTGFLGAVLLIGGGVSTADNSHPWYALLVILASLMYALSANTIKYKLSDLPSKQIAAVSLAMVSLPNIIFLFTTDISQRIAEHPQANISLLAIVVLALVGTCLAIIIFNTLIKVSGSVFAVSVTYCIPVVALLWGVLDGEEIHIFHGLALICILAGVYLVNKAK